MASRTYGPLLDALRGVRWPARRAVGAALPGAHRSRQRGTSGEFTEYRLYRQGDDPRQLDWKLLGRSDRAFVRLTDDRAQLPTWVVVDASASMAFPEAADANDATTDTHSDTGGAVSGRATTWSVACALAVGLAAVAHASSDPVGLILVGRDGPARLSARTRRGTVGELARLLHATVVGGDVPMAPLLASIPPLARVVLITDLLGDAEALRRAAAQRAVAGGIVECLHVVATEELSLPAGAHLARDPDDATRRRTMSPRMDREYRARFDAFRAECARQWRATGAGYAEVRTDASVARVVRQVASGQARGDAAAIAAAGAGETTRR